VQPASFDDLVVQISLVRPGPVAADMVTPFVEAHAGRRPARYPHPDLIPLLRSTHGVVVFNEQVTGLIAIMARCDLAMGEEARRALSSPERLRALEAWFRARAEQAGYAPGVVEQVWEILLAMGAYGFCKAHAVAFAVPTLQSAWLKAHHAAAFYAGVLAHDPGMYPKRVILADARRRGVAILPLDVQSSDADYRAEPLPGGGFGLRLALSEVRGITRAQAERIAAARPYGSLSEWWTRTGPSLPVARNLARVGALGSLAPGAHRHEILLQVDELHRRHAAAGSPAQLALPAEPAAARPTGLPAMSAAQELEAELSVIGLDASRNLLVDYHPLLAELGASAASSLAEIPTGSTVLVAGAKVSVQTPPNRTGKRIIFTTLDDGTGLVDLAFFDQSHAACAEIVMHGWLLLVRGTLARRGPRSVSIVGTRVWELGELARAYREQGPAAVRRLLAAPPHPSGGGAENGDGHGAGPGRRWHASPGSAG
jgi:error-prone DNA polymerase